MPSIVVLTFPPMTKTKTAPTAIATQPIGDIARPRSRPKKPLRVPPLRDRDLFL